MTTPFEIDSISSISLRKIICAGSASEIYRHRYTGGQVDYAYRDQHGQLWANYGTELDAPVDSLTELGLIDSLDLEAERSAFLAAFAAAAGIDSSAEAAAQWAGFSHQLSDTERRLMEYKGATEGTSAGAEFLATHQPA